jgi:sensor c-di-GMP phosphodiesterase-like protein
MLTYWVIEQLAEELGDWLHHHPDASLAINVPPEILGRGGLVYAAQKVGLEDLYRTGARFPFFPAPVCRVLSCLFC